MRCAGVCVSVWGEEGPVSEVCGGVCFSLG